MKPMMLQRQLAADDLYEAQDIFHCVGCEVGLTRAALKDTDEAELLSNNPKGSTR